MIATLNRWLARVPRVLPSSCALCGCSADDALCHECLSRFFAPSPSRCTCCAAPLRLGVDTVCGACLKKPPHFDATIVAADYAVPVDQLVLALKFGGKLALAKLFARLLRQTTQLTQRPAVLVAVPLGERRLAERGFNQALEIARPLARTWNIPLAPGLLRRSRETLAQSMLPTAARQKNIRGAFEVPADALARVRGMHVGVVDDVMTTGETLDEVATTLKRAGAARVTNFVFARTAAR